MPITDLLSPVSSSSTASPIVDTLAAPGKAIAAASASIASGTNWPSGVVYVSIYNTQTLGSLTVKDSTTQTDWKATLSGTTLSNLTYTGGVPDRAYTTGAIVEITPTARYAYDLYTWATAFANLDGSLKSAAVQTALNLGSSSLNGWNALGFTFNSVVANGNRSYTCTISGQDLTSTLSAGMRVRTTRTVAAPTQATSLNGTNQYWSKVAPAGMTFTDDFVAGGWVKLSSYSTAGSIVSRYSGGNGWALQALTTGQIQLTGYNALVTNNSYVQSYQSLPLNKWVHVAAQLDMSTFTATPTTSYVMIDGVDVPSAVGRGGTSPTALVQAGNLEVGSTAAGTFWTGKIAQAFVTSAKVTQATIQSNYYAQSISPTETSLVSAYSFNGNGNDLNTTNANNLTSNNGVAATNADSPFGGQAGGAISSTLDYGIVQSATFSTNTTLVIQVPEGCTIPTSGGVASVAYSSNAAPYGFPKQRAKWTIETFLNTSLPTGAVSATWSGGNMALNIPIGSWATKYDVTHYSTRAGASDYRVTSATLSTSTTAETDARWTRKSVAGVLGADANYTTQHQADYGIELTTATPYYTLVKEDQAVTTQGINPASFIKAENAYL